MLIQEDGGAPLRASLDVKVEDDGRRVAVEIHSAGGRGDAPGVTRNPDYPAALTLLLRRLGSLNATLDDAMVTSPRALSLPEAERRVHPKPWSLPVTLGAVEDFGSLRLALTRPQKEIASRSSGGGGNERKRLRLSITLPNPMRQDEVMSALGLVDEQTMTKVSAPAEVRDDAVSLLRRLIGEDLLTLNDSPNKILAVNPPRVIVATERSPQGQPVDIADVEHGLRLLRQDGAVNIDPNSVGHRSAFVGAVLSTLPGTETLLNPAQVRLVGAGSQPVSERTITHEGATDRPATRQERREQGKLRAFLIGDADLAICALCGDEYPARFLWASHIKTRKVCTEAERTDLGNIAMLACVFGCDALYEHGFISVDETGVIRTAAALREVPSLALKAQRLAGIRCSAHRAETSHYFRWHRENRYLGD